MFPYRISDESITTYQITETALTTDENLALFIDLTDNKNLKARDKLIIGNIKLVLRVINNAKIMDYAYDYDDLLQIGIIGLIKAIDSYDYHKGYTFATYALRIIQNEINMLWRKWKHYNNIISLNEVCHTNDEGNELTLEDTIPDEKSFEEDLLYQSQLMLIDEMLDSLPERDKTIVCMRFGLRGYTKLKQREVADILHMSQANVSRRVVKSIKHIQKKWYDRL